jgi:hypothetical protein
MAGIGPPPCHAMALFTVVYLSIGVQSGGQNARLITLTDHIANGVQLQV